MTSDAFAPNPLEDGVRRVLDEAGYSVVSMVLGEHQLLVAEDSYAVLALACTDEWKTIAPLLGDLQISLANWAAGGEPGGKLWDLYLVVLLSARFATSEELTAVREFTGDLRFVRKIVRGGVEANPIAIRKALAPFLALELPPRSVGDPLDALEQRLLERGLDDSVVKSAVASFRATGEVSMP